MSTVKNILPNGHQRLAEADPEVADILQHEMTRQWKGLELIASENFTSQAVLDANGTAFTNKYAEGLIGARYYAGCEQVDKLEQLCQDRAMAAFGLDKSEWGVNVQPYSGSPANWEVYVGVLEPHDRVMGLNLASGGHLTHGYYTPKKKISATSIFFESMPYFVDDKTGLLDYDAILATAKVFRPKLLIGGASAYAREWDWARMRAIADEVGALLFIDMAHIAGLVATGLHSSPFEHAHIVTTTTHKTLRGPRAGMIFFRLQGEGLAADLKNKINFAVFPSCQGGPHMNTISAVAVQMKEVQSDHFKAYSQQTVDNAKTLAAELLKHDYTLVTGGTDNHLVLWDLRPLGISGSKMEFLCDAVSMSCNKNCVPGEYNAFSPGGVRLGAGALTSRGMSGDDFVKVADFLHRVVELAKEIMAACGSKKLVDFKAAAATTPAVATLKAEVEAFAMSFDMPGFDVAALKYKE